MPPWTEIIAAAAPLLPSVMSLLGVLIGAGLAFRIQRSMAKRANRRELALSALEAVTTARGLVAAARVKAGTTGAAPEPLYAAEAATSLWARFEMLAATEKRPEDYRALSANGMAIHEWLMGGARSEDDLQRLGAELQRLSMLLVAWERGKAKGRDFRLSQADAFWRFGPEFTDADLPPDA